MPRIVFTTWRQFCDAIVEATDFDPDGANPAGTVEYQTYGPNIVHIEIKADLVGGKRADIIPF